LNSSIVENIYLIREIKLTIKKCIAILNECNDNKIINISELSYCSTNDLIKFKNVLLDKIINSYKFSDAIVKEINKRNYPQMTDKDFFDNNGAVRNNPIINDNGNSLCTMTNPQPISTSSDNNVLFPPATFGFGSTTSEFPPATFRFGPATNGFGFLR